LLQRIWCWTSSLLAILHASLGPALRRFNV
jgi:hypothetical protein